jgi:hypothetical protein
MNRNSHVILILLTGVLAVAQPAVAVDGVIEINGVQAAEGGITAGDSAGYPITLSTPGSYVLTSDLVQIDPNLHVIQVTSDHVSIDLNGFSIRGPNVNTVTLTSSYVTSVTCGQSGSGSGIHSDNLYTRVWNGTVTGMAAGGIRLDNHSTARDLIVQDSCGRGVEVGYHGLVRHVIVTENASYGLYVWDKSIVESCTASDNGATGIYVNRDSIVRHCTAYRNKGAGIDASFRSIIQTCTASLNNADGLIVRGWTRIIDCNINANDGRPISTPGQGANVYSGCNINNNNTAMGPQVIELPPNACDGNTTCP